MKKYYKLFAVNDVLKRLTQKQIENLYSNNIFLAVTRFTGCNKKEVLTGALIVYDYDGKATAERVKKNIPDLIANGQEVAYLPKELKEDFPDFSSWYHGKCCKVKIEGEWVERPAKCYYRTSNIYKKLENELPELITA